MKLDFKLKKELKEFLKKKLEEEKNTAYIYAPYKLNNKELEEIRRKFAFLSNKKIIPEVDNSLIAGFKIKVGTKVYDFSVKSVLNSLKQSWYENLG